ncbi:MAG: hypothetical protein HZC42_02395 [Candidatus Eisenbacteria bacterium]|nr:hypothetical protein [Candidatus Eisenbacteria bacterium]
MRFDFRAPFVLAALLGAACAAFSLVPAAPARACDPAAWDSLAALSVAGLESGAAAFDGGGFAGMAAGPERPTGALSTGTWSHLISLETNNYNPDCNPWVSADERHLFFITSDAVMGPPRPGFQGDWDIYEASWDDIRGVWGTPVNVGPPINTAGGERRPSSTATGDTLFFSRGNQILVAFRSGGTWSSPVALFNGSDPCITSDLAQIYYVKQNDIWLADRGSSITDWVNHRSVGPPVNTTQYAEVRPFITHDKTQLYWSDFPGGRPGGYGGADLWFSTWTGSAWGAPVNVGPPVNTDRITCTPFLTPDRRRLYTSSESYEGSRGTEDVWIAYLDSMPAPREVVHEPGVWSKCGELDGAWNVYALAQLPAGDLFAATSPEGKVFRSTDLGNSWAPTAPLAGASIVYSLLAASDGSLYAGTYPNGDVFRTTDAGASWQPTANLSGATAVRALIETASDRILAGTSPRPTVFATTDAGQSWATLATIAGISNGITCLLEASQGVLYAGGWGQPQRSTDGGLSWSAVSGLPFPGEARSIDALREMADSSLCAAGWVHGHGGYLFRSTDAGATWDTTGRIMIGAVHAVRVYALDEDASGTLRIGYQPGPDSVAQRSTDGGATWQIEGALTGTHEVLAFLRAADGTLFAATTPNGDVFRWSGGVTGVPAPSGDAAAAALFRPAAPNPSRSGVTLRFVLPRPGRAVLALSDVQGRRVRVLNDDWLEAGEHTRTWDHRDEAGQLLPDGLYFARLEFENQASGCKLAVVR